MLVYVRSGCPGVVSVNICRSLKWLSRTVAAAPLRLGCPAGYSGWHGVLMSGCQAESTAVSAFSSLSASGIEVAGRQVTSPEIGSSEPRRALCAGVSQLLLASRVAAGHPHRSVPCHGHRRRDARNKDHVWHMNTISSFVRENDNLLMRTPYQVVDLADPASEATATAWWLNLTETGGEGAVVKPLPFVATNSRGLLQPAMKCRGREYLRIIYGPEYTLSEHLDRLRERGLSGKRSLALREFASGIEGLERAGHYDSRLRPSGHRALDESKTTWSYQRSFSKRARARGNRRSPPAWSTISAMLRRPSMASNIRFSCASMTRIRSGDAWYRLKSTPAAPAGSRSWTHRVPGSRTGT